MRTSRPNTGETSPSFAGSTLAWTVLAAPALKDDPATGVLRAVIDGKGRAARSARGHFAAALLDAVGTDAWVRHVVGVTDPPADRTGRVATVATPRRRRPQHARADDKLRSRDRARGSRPSPPTASRSPRRSGSTGTARRSCSTASRTGRSSATSRRTRRCPASGRRPRRRGRHHGRGHRGAGSDRPAAGCAAPLPREYRSAIDGFGWTPAEHGRRLLRRRCA